MVRILEDVQQQEKAKLDLTVKWQVLAQREVAQGAGSDDGGVQNGASSGDSSGVDPEEKGHLRRR